MVTLREIALGSEASSVVGFSVLDGHMVVLAAESGWGFIQIGYARGDGNSIWPWRRPSVRRSS